MNKGLLKGYGVRNVDKPPALQQSNFSKLPNPRLAPFETRVVSDLNNSIFISNSKAWVPLNGRAIISCGTFDDGGYQRPERIIAKHIIPKGVLLDYDTLVLTFDVETGVIGLDPSSIYVRCGQVGGGTSNELINTFSIVNSDDDSDSRIMCSIMYEGGTLYGSSTGEISQYKGMDFGPAVEISLDADLEISISGEAGWNDARSGVPVEHIGNYFVFNVPGQGLFYYGAIRAEGYDIPEYNGDFWISDANLNTFSVLAIGTPAGPSVGNVRIAGYGNMYTCYVELLSSNSQPPILY